MSAEQTVSAVSTWIQSLPSTLVRINARGGVQLRMPRDKDCIVTFSEDTEAEPEQCPAIVIEIGRFQWSPQNVSNFYGAVDATLHLLDDAQSGSEARIKMVRWVDALTQHCKFASSIFGDSRIVPRSMDVAMGKTKGDLNAIAIDLHFQIPLSF